MKLTPRMTIFLISMAGFYVTGWLPGIDHISCLQAKSKFKACADLSQKEKFPLRDCLNADSGYIDCRDRNEDGWHQRCLATKGQYASCRDYPALTHDTCSIADGGFKDCVGWQGNPLLCLGVKPGYGECRKRNPFLQHINCVSADAGYADCRDAGGLHIMCLDARRSFKYCYVKDRLSVPICVGVGKGYAECRDAGFTLAHCRLADAGFADCVNYKE